MKITEYVASKIRELRTSYGGKGISQEVLAKHLKVTTNTVSRWETGVYKPGLNDLDNLARFFGVSILTFFPQDAQAPVKKETEALLRAAQTLPAEDLEEVRRYAEYRLANRINKGMKAKKD